MRCTRTTAVALAAGAALVLGLAGCGSSAKSTSLSGNKAPARDAGAPAQGAPAPNGGGGAANEAAPGTGKQTAPLPAPTGAVTDDRAIIYTGSIIIRVSKVDKAADAASGLATGAGGVGARHRRS